MATARGKVETPDRNPQFTLLIPDKITVISGLSYARFAKEYGVISNRIRAIKELTLP